MEIYSFNITVSCFGFETVGFNKLEALIELAFKGYFDFKKSIVAFNLMKIEFDGYINSPQAILNISTQFPDAVFTVKITGGAGRSKNALVVITNGKINTIYDYSNIYEFANDNYSKEEIIELIKEDQMEMGIQQFDFFPSHFSAREIVEFSKELTELNNGDEY